VSVLPVTEGEAVSSSGVRAQRGAVLLSAQGAVYIEVPKVACSSIKITLASLLGIDLEAVGGDPHKVHFPAPASCQSGPTLYPGLFTFAFVRNPWDRLVSCYRDKILGEAPDFTSFHPARGVACCLARFDVFRAGMSFDEFVKAVAAVPDKEADDHFRSQHTFVTNTLGGVGVDFVGRFETLGRDFQRVCEKLGLPSLTLPHVQAASTARRYTQYYTLRTRSRVASRFRDNVSLFGYQFGRE
jgi:chondroitin 4-sulfotransferase 11